MSERRGPGPGGGLIVFLVLQRPEPLTVSSPPRTTTLRTKDNKEIKVLKCNGVSPNLNKRHYSLPQDYLSHVVVLGKSSAAPPVRGPSAASPAMPAMRRCRGPGLA